MEVACLVPVPVEALSPMDEDIGTAWAAHVRLVLRDLVFTVLAEARLEISIRPIFHGDSFLATDSLISDLLEFLFAERACVLGRRCPLLDAFEAELVTAAVDGCFGLSLERLDADGALLLSCLGRLAHVAGYVVADRLP